MQIYLLYPACLYYFYYFPLNFPRSSSYGNAEEFLPFSAMPVLPPMPRIRKREKNKSYSSFLFSPSS